MEIPKEVIEKLKKNNQEQLIENFSKLKTDEEKKKFNKSIIKK